MYKKELLNNIIKHLSTELENSELAAKNAHLAATDDQSVAETQYDTLAIEASYLAEGQSRRVDEIKYSLHLFEQLAKQEESTNSQVKVGSLVQLEKDTSENAWFYIGPAAGGFTCEINGLTFTLITPKSPMGSALINKEEADEVTIQLGSNTIVDYIDTII
jgi:transcription elongation GreA/GreB family factor